MELPVVINMPKSRVNLVIDAIKDLDGECHYKELFNYINSREHDYQGMTPWELRGHICKIKAIERDGDIVRLRE